MSDPTVDWMGLPVRQPPVAFQPPPDKEMPSYYELYNTQLEPEQERKFQDWVYRLGKSTGRHSRHLDMNDYDLRGFYKEYGDTMPADHFTDKYKKPNHPTFSTESIYSSDDTPGGEWWGDRIYKPSDWVLQQHGGAEQYARKFRVEAPDSTLYLDQPYETPRPDPTPRARDTWNIGPRRANSDYPLEDPEPGILRRRVPTP